MREESASGKLCPWRGLGFALRPACAGTQGIRRLGSVCPGLCSAGPLGQEEGNRFPIYGTPLEPLINQGFGPNSQHLSLMALPFIPPLLSAFDESPCHRLEWLVIGLMIK